MKKLLCISFLLLLAVFVNAQGPALTIDDNEFLVNKKVVAKVENVKLGGFKGREMRLLGPNNEVLLVFDLKSITVSTTPPNYIHYVSINVPSTNDSIQVYIDSLKADGVKIGFMAPDDEAWAEYVYRKQLVKEDGTLQMDNLGLLKARYPIGAVKDYENKTAYAAKCASSINKPRNRNASIPSKVTETGRETKGTTATIKYNIEHEGVLIATAIATGPAVNLSNERAEVDFKTKVIYKKPDIENQPMNYEITNTEGCKLAVYSPMSKVLATSRTDKGTTHGIMKPILDGKVDTVQTRIEVMSAMIDYLIKLGYL